MGEAENYEGAIPRGTDGEQAARARVSTAVLSTGEHELGRDGLNDLLGYLGWNFWDATHGTDADAEGEQADYEALGALQAWQRYPALLRLIVERIGLDGVRTLGAGARRQIGSKLGAAHVWALAVALGLGRGVSMGLGQIDGQEREDDLRDGLEFVRQLYAGVRGPDAALFGSADGYRAATLDREWVDWLAGGVEAAGDAVERYRGLDAAAGRLAGLLHFGSRVASQVGGPYPAGEGAYLIVRDHFLADDLYHWADVADGLPYALTEALVVRADAAPRVNDAGLLLAEPGALSAASVFARDRWDTPVEQVRRLDGRECDEITRRCTEAADRLERRIAAMPRRDRVMAGAQVYYTDPIAPFARAAGLWAQLCAEHDFFELDRLTSQLYYDLVPGGAARDLVPRLVRSGAAFAPVKDPISAEEAMPALHLLALREHATELPVPASDLTGAGLVSQDADGAYRLTEAGRSVHERLLAAERRTYEPARLAQAYERFAALDEPLRALVAKWRSAAEPERGPLLAELTDVVQRARVALRRTNEQLLRFEPYLPKLRRALARAEQGESEYVASPDVESIAVVWRELDRDYRLTQGIEL